MGIVLRWVRGEGKAAGIVGIVVRWARGEGKAVLERYDPLFGVCFEDGKAYVEGKVLLLMLVSQ